LNKDGAKELVRQPVTSSNISSVGYDKATQVLEIEFKGGSVYQYFDVPETIYNGLLAASSVGSYFHAHIKNVYQFNQVR
jgi:hypothetical protein